MATPHSAAAMTTAAPRRVTCLVQPDSRVVTKLPTGIAAYSQPAAVAPPHACAMAGNSAVGMAKVMATMSTTYVPTSSGRRRA